MRFTKLSGVVLLLLGSSELMGGNLDIQLKKISDWGSGFCSNVYVFNRDKVKEKWEVSFDAGGLITTFWSGNYTQDSDSLQTTVSGVSWNEYVKPSGEVKFGYCANRVKPKPLPPQEGDLVITQTVKKSWRGGSCNHVKVLNTTTHPIDWSVEFVAKGKVTTLWSANYTQDATSLKVLANGLDWIGTM